jgi:ubiquitin C-terminal hydrolase
MNVSEMFEIEIIELAKLSFDINHNIYRDPTHEFLKIDQEANKKRKKPIVLNISSRNDKENIYRKNYIKDFFNVLDFLLTLDPSININLDIYKDYDSKKSFIDKENIKDIFKKLIDNHLIYFDRPNIDLYPIGELVPVIPENNIVIDPITKGIVGMCLRGLNNPNNRCWFHSFTQLIASIPEIRDCFVDLDIQSIDPLNGLKLFDGLIIKDTLIKINNELSEISDFNNIFNPTEKTLSTIDYDNKLEGKRKYFKIIQDNISDKNKLILFQKLLRSLLNRDASDAITISDSELTLLYDAYASFTIGNEDTHDADDAITLFINKLENSNPTLLGLFEIFSCKLITKKICKSTNYEKVSITNLPIIELKRGLPDIQTSLNKILQNDAITQNTVNDPYYDCSKPYKLEDYEECFEIKLKPTTRYLFIKTQNLTYKYNEITRIMDILTQKTIINGSIIMENHNFNLFGAIIYNGSIRGGHYVYHLFKGDGTTDLLREYNDNSVSTTTIYNKDELASVVIYRRVN